MRKGVVGSSIKTLLTAGKGIQCPIVSPENWRQINGYKFPQYEALASSLLSNLEDADR